MAQTQVDVFKTKTGNTGNPPGHLRSILQPPSVQVLVLLGFLAARWTLRVHGTESPSPLPAPRSPRLLQERHAAQRSQQRRQQPRRPRRQRRVTLGGLKEGQGVRAAALRRPPAEPKAAARAGGPAMFGPGPGAHQALSSGGSIAK